MLLSNGANCIASKVGTSCMHMVLFPNAWTAKMHHSSVCVNCCQIFIFFETNLYLFPNSMSNLLIETGAIKTFPKSLSFNHFSGNFCTLLSSPFPKARNLKQRSLKVFVSPLFDKFIPFCPTLMGRHRFHTTHKAGPWTLLTSNLFNALLAVLKTGEDGGWLTIVACWHMRHLLRWINWR